MCHVVTTRQPRRLRSWANGMRPTTWSSSRKRG